tara:strand:+ start:1605 stop:1889 length:285 start_codon:yes stop_codon:yes gene_type:complete
VPGIKDRHWENPIINKSLILNSFSVRLLSEYKSDIYNKNPKKNVVKIIRYVTCFIPSIKLNSRKPKIKIGTVPIKISLRKLILKKELTLIFESR